MPQRSSITREKHDEVVALYNDGWSMDSIREMAFVSPSSIKRIVRAAKKQGRIKRSPHQLGKTKESVLLDQQIADLYNQYFSNAEIGESLGFTASTISRKIRRIRNAPGGEKIIKRNRRHTGRHRVMLERYRRFIGYYEAYIPYHEIAEKEGIAYETVRGVMARAKRQYPTVRLTRGEKRKRKALQLYAEGISRYRIADTLGVSMESVKRYLHKVNAGQVGRPPTKKGKENQYARSESDE